MTVRRGGFTEWEPPETTGRFSTGILRVIAKVGAVCALIGDVALMAGVATIVLVVPVMVVARWLGLV